MQAVLQDAFEVSHALLVFADQCVDKAKVEESEQKAIEYSKKVRQ